MRIRQNVRHAFGIHTLTKSRFGKNQSYEALTPARRYDFTIHHVFISSIHLLSSLAI